MFASKLRQPRSELKLADLQLTADRWPSPQSASAAVRYLRAVLKWAAHPGRGYVASDLALITPPATPKRRQRALDAKELGKLLPVLRASSSAYAAAMQFILLTLTRRDEVASARWQHIDFGSKLWRLPDTKNGQEHIVPLSDQAIALLRTRPPKTSDPGAFVFAGAGEGGGKNPHPCARVAHRTVAAARGDGGAGLR